MTNNFLLIRKPVRILIELKKPKNIGQNHYRMSKATDCVYSYYIKIIKRLEEIGFLKVEKKGRDCIACLTPKGEELVYHLSKINVIIEKIRK